MDDDYDLGYRNGNIDGFVNCKELVIELIKNYQAKYPTFYAGHAAALIKILKDEEFKYGNWKFLENNY